MEEGCGGARGLCGFLSQNCCCPNTPAVPPMLNPELAATVVATVEELISLPFPDRENMLDPEDEVPPVPDKPLRMDDAAEVGADPLWFMHHDATDAALVRPLCVLAPGDWSRIRANRRAKQLNPSHCVTVGARAHAVWYN